MGQLCAKFHIRAQVEEERFDAYMDFLQKLRKAKQLYMKENRDHNHESLHNFFKRVKTAEMQRRVAERNYASQLGTLGIRPRPILNFALNNHIGQSIGVAYAIYLGKGSIVKLETMKAEESVNSNHDYCGVASALLHRHEEQTLQTLHDEFNAFAMKYNRKTGRVVNIPFDLHVSVL